MTTTFHPFPRLPFELRARIWQLTVEPRTVNVRVLHTQIRVPNPAPIPTEAGARARRLSHITRHIPRLVSSTPVPATLHTCREARNLGLYKEAFSELSTEERRYAWLNLEIDIIFIERSSLEHFKPVAHIIKRLKFERKYDSDEGRYYFESRYIGIFVNAREIYVVCADGIESWHEAWMMHPWPCERQNLFFIDQLDGRMMNSMELDEMCDQELKDLWAAEGYDYATGEPLG